MNFRRGLGIAIAILLLIGVGAYYKSRSSNSAARSGTDADDQVALPADDAVPLPTTVPREWKIKKFWDIHRVKPGTFDQDADFIIHDQEKISEWFQVEFENAGTPYLLFVTKIQALNEDGELQDGHGQAVIAGGGLYKKNHQDWELVLANENIGEFGAFGEAPEVKSPVVIDIGRGRKGVLIESSFCNQGECSTTGSLVETSPDRLQEVGNFSIGGDNKGQCNDETDLKCYSFSGKLETIPDGSKEYYDLVIRKTGRELSEEGSVLQAQDSVVSYQDEKYEETK